MKVKIKTERLVVDSKHLCKDISKKEAQILSEHIKGALKLNFTIQHTYYIKQVLAFVCENLKQVGSDGNIGGNRRRYSAIIGRRQTEIAWNFDFNLENLKVINLPEQSSAWEVAAEDAKWKRRKRSG